MAIVPIVANRRAGGQLPRGGGLHQIKRILVPVYTEHLARDNKRIARVLREAKLRIANACSFTGRPSRFGTVMTVRRTTCQWIQLLQEVMHSGH